MTHPKAIRGDRALSPTAEILSPMVRSIVEESPDVTMEEIEQLKDFEISDTDARRIAERDVLEVVDMPRDSQIGHLKFAWLSPAHRAKNGMQQWRWVKGDLARIVREKGIITETIGGGSATSAITTGDLMLGFIPRVAHQKIKSAYRKASRDDTANILDEGELRSALTNEQLVERDVSIRHTYEGQEVR